MPAKTIQIEPNDSAMSLTRAAASLQNGDMILLKRGGTYGTANGIVINAANIILGAFGEGPAPIIRFTGSKKFTPIIRHTGDGLNLSDINLDSIYNASNPANPLPVGLNLAGRNAVVRNVTITDCDFGVKCDGAIGVTISKLAVPKAYEYPLWCSLGGDRKTQSRDIAISESFFGTSVGQHGVRVHSTKNFSLTNCAIDTRTYKSALCLRDGENFLIEGCRITGNVILCPLMDGDGGGNDPAGPERTRKLALRLRGLKIHDCDITPFDNNGITIGMGGIDILIDANRIQTKCSFATSLKIDSRYAARGPSSGAVTNNKVSAGENFTTMVRHNTGKFAVRGNRLNGKAFNQ